MPDFFDRLVSPVNRAELRPRPPGPFERIKALRAEPAEETELAAPPAVEPSPPPTDVLREIRREVRTTDRLTFVRTEQASPEPPHPVQPASRLETPQPASPPAPAVRDPAPEPAKRTEPQRISPEPVPQPSPGVLRVEAAPVPSEQPRTRVAAAAARASAPHPRNRAPERTEPAVQVEIGRLEVNAARPQQRTPPEPAQRRDPAMNLADYLSERANS